MDTPENALQGVKSRIDRAARDAGRDPRDIVLLAVSKTVAPDRIHAAYIAGQRDFGENYVQEAIAKMDALAADAITWHFIGPIQSNKTRSITERFDWVHSVERLKVAERLSAQRPADRPRLQVCLQVNTSGEASKSGCAPDAVPELARAVATLPRLRLRGLMTIPEPTDDPSVQLGRFRALASLAAGLRADGIEVDTLSMGMSADLEQAIAAGATIVRVGTAIFGARPRAA